jgi:hypothetical protein
MNDGDALELRYVHVVWVVAGDTCLEASHDVRSVMFISIMHHD